MAESNLSICENSLEYFQFDPHTADFLIIGNPIKTKEILGRAIKIARAFKRRGSLCKEKRSKDMIKRYNVKKIYKNFED